MTNRLLAWLFELSSELGLSGTRWAIGGAVAMAAHGLERETKDLDIFVHDSDRRVLQIFRDHDAPSGMLSESHARVTVPECPRGEHLDVVFPTFDLLEDAISRAKLLNVAGRLFPVLTALDLATCKAMSESPKDGRDLETLLAAGTVQPNEVKAVLPTPLPERASPYVVRHRNVPLALARIEAWSNGR